MPENPYSPPSAAVHDDSPEPRKVRPKTVQAAVALLSVATAFAFCREAFLSDDPAVRIAQLITLAVFAILIQGIYAGRNWARVVFTAIVVFGSVTTIPQVFGDFATAPIAATTGFILLAAHLVALYLLFDEPGNTWFKRPRSESGTVV